MRRIGILIAAAVLLWASAAIAQTPAAQSRPAPGGGLADELAQRLSRELQVKTVAGAPVQAGTVTLIPILMVDVNFAAANLPSQVRAGAPATGGFLMSGEARPLGFVAITKKGTRFISAGKPPAK